VAQPALERIAVLLAAAAQTAQQRTAAGLEVLDLADKLIFTVAAELDILTTVVTIRTDEVAVLSSAAHEERLGLSVQEISVALQELVQLVTGQ
jgi:methylmalonyl-CoA mutase N-terminal domain/subunit